MCACVTAAASGTPAHARDAVVTSFDGTRIVVHFHPAGGQAGDRRAPTVLVGQGYPHRADSRPDLDTPDRIGAATLRAAGYNVLTWDPRGLGGSGGTVMFDSPDFEARDVSALIDFVAAQPEALLDGARDPRVGMSGSSYGGGIQFVGAAIDRRIDAIAPDIAWHSLPTSLFRDGAIKTGWLTLICGGGETAALADGILFPAAGLQLGGTATELKRACLEALTGGPMSSASRQWLAARGPRDLIHRIRAPTLITQGTVDTLFPLTEAIANYDLLRRNDVSVKMLWYCGGHGECRTADTDPRHVARAGLTWFARWLERDPGVDTGPAFEWMSDDGIWRAGPDYPLAPRGALDASGAGSLDILPLDGIVPRIPGSPGVRRATVRFASPTTPGDVIGEPLLTLVYRGSARPARSFLYAQVVDGGRVVGGQVTPIPVLLDGHTHTVRRSLEAVALRVRPQSDLRLQIVAATTAYGPQRSLGSVRLHSIQASLPLVDAGRSGRVRSGPAARRAPRRLRIAMTSRRLRRVSRIELRGRLRSRPCAGSVRFTIRSGAIRRTVRAAIGPACTVAVRLRMRVRAGRRARVSALFEGNERLAPSRARSLARRLR